MFNSFTRREFLRTTGVAGAATFAGLHSAKAFGFDDSVKKLQLQASVQILSASL